MMVTKSKSFIATPPGATIKEQLRERNLTQKEFAVRMDMSEKHICNLIKGDVILTPDVAIRLEIVLGIPAKFWNNLEAIYREKKLKADAENQMDTDIEIVKQLAYNEMAKVEWVPKTRNMYEKVVNLRRYFEVVRLDLINSSKVTQIACRRLSETQKSDYALTSWAQRAKIVARDIKTQSIDFKKLSYLLPEIRSMTIMEPSEFCPYLEQKLADCGVALVFLPHIKGSFLHGATFYDGNKIVVGLTVRGKDADKFWFSLFHELAHILLGHLNRKEGTSQEDEDAADKFARDILIPQSDLDKFVNNNEFSKESIMNFAKQIDIAPGIVVGRLQNEKYIEYSWYHDLKIKYEIV